MTGVWTPIGRCVRGEESRGPIVDVDRSVRFGRRVKFGDGTWKSVADWEITESARTAPVANDKREEISK